jgi:bifunctional non-homologous end joining protein LigD
MALREYARKRNFKNTPEPSGGGAGGRKLIFVVQLHHASHRHYDFRLEWNGVLKSWAVPKGPSFDPKVKRLAMEVEDHPISYATFEGDIPKGNYGAGHVDVFDHGTWEPQGSAREGLAKGDLKFTLHGDILRGSWVLVRTRRQGTKNQWLLIKHDDGYANPREANDFLDTKKDRPLPPRERKNFWPSEPSPKKSVKRARLANSKTIGEHETITGEAFAPELCRTLTSPSTGDDWLHEVKWDGYRMLATVAKGKVRLWSRNAIEWTHKLPELVKAIASLKLKSAQLDGEMIVLRDGRDDFNALQGRLSSENKDPAMLILFDMPHLNGYSLRDVPLVERKAKLAELLEQHDNPLLRFSEHVVGNGAHVFEQAVGESREGIVSKRVDSHYVGTRNGDWVKVKGRPSDEFVVIGFTEPKGSRSGLGALLLAKPKKGELVYAGRVGTGFSDENLRDLRKQLTRIVVPETDVDVSAMPPKDLRAAHWVKPQMIIEVFHQGTGGQGLLRQPAFKTLRVDKSLDDIGNSPRARQKPKKKTVAKKSAKLKVTHAERTVFGGTGITKGDVASYYEQVAARMLPEIADRPLSILRCPNGVGAQCFFQKHVKQGMGDHIHPVRIREENVTREYLSVRDVDGLLELVQMNVLEFHPWGARSDDVEHCDRIVFDLDPHPTVEWKRVVAAARDMKKQLESIGLRSFLRTSGGKGLHVVVPLAPACGWDEVREFSKSVAQAMSTLRPKEYVAVAGERNRSDRIFIDWLRNGRGATSIASYSVRARERAGVAMPLAWDQLGRLKSGDFYTIENAIDWIRKHPDPWKGIDSVKQTLPDL